MADELTPNEQHRRAVLAEMPPPGARKRLTMEPIASDDNVLQQLVASVARIESGVTDIRDGFDALLEAAADDEPLVMTAAEDGAVVLLRVMHDKAKRIGFADVCVPLGQLDAVLRYIEHVRVKA